MTVVVVFSLLMQASVPAQAPAPQSSPPAPGTETISRPVDDHAAAPASTMSPTTTVESVDVALTLACPESNSPCDRAKFSAAFQFARPSGSISLSLGYKAPSITLSGIR